MAELDRKPAAAVHTKTTEAASASDPLPIRMLHDRLLVSTESEGERRSGGGILIPATVRMGRKLAWAKVIAVGDGVRSATVGARVLFDPEEKNEVDLRGHTYLLLRDRDLHAVAEESSSDSETGLYL